MKRLRVAALLLLGALLASPTRAPAADYPVKPIRVVVPYGPGGATDIVARILGEQLKEKFHQPVVVENKPGGNGVVALQETVRAKPDGYTFLIGNITTNLLTPLIGDPPMPFDPFKDLVPVARLADVPGVFLATKVNFPPNTVQEVVDYARARPGEVNHNTAGILAYSHIDFLMLQKRTGIKLVAIPLRAGAGGGQIDLMNGAVQIALQNAATVTPLVKARKAQGIGGDQRTAAARAARRAHPQGGGVRRNRHQRLERHVRPARGAERDPRHHDGGDRRNSHLGTSRQAARGSAVHRAAHALVGRGPGLAAAGGATVDTGRRRRQGDGRQDAVTSLRRSWEVPCKSKSRLVKRPSSPNPNTR